MRALGRIVVVIVVGAGTLGTPGSMAPAADEDRPGMERPAADPLAALPLSFEPNGGRFDDPIRYIARGAGATLGLTRGGIVFSADGADVTLRPVGANRSPRLVARELLPGVVNSYVGPRKDWRTGIPTYGRIRYRGLYPGIDLVVRGSRSTPAYDFVISPGADPGRIAYRLEGTTSLRVAPSGDLVARTPAGAMTHGAPVLYQPSPDGRVPVEGRFFLRGDVVGFEVGSYDPRLPLVIDPPVDLAWATYLGGSDVDSARAIEATAHGVYVTGQTRSTDFPVSSSPAQSVNNGWADVFVSRIDTSGQWLNYSTYLGGAVSEDIAAAIAVDPAASVYVAGDTGSSDFPVTDGAPDATYGGREGFVFKLTLAGALSYSTLLGGGGWEYVYGVAADAEGAAYVTGYTESSDYPTTAGALDTSKGSSYSDAFVTKVDPTGTAFAYSTYLGGTDGETGRAIAVDAAGSAYVTGQTGLYTCQSYPYYYCWGGSGTFPTTTGAYDRTLTGYYDVFLAKLNPAGSGLAYSTFLGGTHYSYTSPESETGQGVAVDAAGNAYVTGYTSSPVFPVTAGAFDTSWAGSIDMFVTKVNAAGSGLLYSTFLGGSGGEQSGGIDVDGDGQVHVTGTTSGPGYPTVGAYQSAWAGGQDAVVSKLNAAGSGLLYSTYLGGASNDVGSAIAVLGGAAYVAGSTASADLPVVGQTPTGIVSGIAHDETLGGTQDAFVAKLVTPSVTVGDVAVAEGNAGETNAVLTLTLAAGGGRDLTVRYATSPRTADPGSDFRSKLGRVVFAPGETTKTVSVPVLGDAVDEANETFSVAFDAEGNAAFDDEAIVTITDDDAEPAIVWQSTSASEGNAGFTPMTFQLSLSSPSGRVVSVDFATRGLSASPDADFERKSGTRVFQPGETVKTVTVNAVGDAIDEDTEVFRLVLSDLTHATVFNDPLGGIVDDDEPPVLTVEDAAAAEGGEVTFRVALSAPSGKTVRAWCGALDDTALGASDFSFTDHEMVLEPGQTEHVMTVPVAADGVDEPDETFVLSVTDAFNATVGRGEATATIQDADPTPAISVANVKVKEGRKGLTPVTLTVRLSAPSAQQVGLTWATANGTAKAPKDYVATGDIVLFAPGETKQTITVAVRGDRLKEKTEKFAVTLSMPQNATVKTPKATISIVNDD